MGSSACSKSARQQATSTRVPSAAYLALQAPPKRLRPVVEHPGSVSEHGGSEGHTHRAKPRDDHSYLNPSRRPLRLDEAPGQNDLARGRANRPPAHGCEIPRYCCMTAVVQPILYPMMCPHSVWASLSCTAF